MGYGRSLVQRLLEAAVLLLVAALAIRWAIEIILSVLWPLLGIAASLIVGATAWRLWQRSRSGW